jgi:hypothetical protein
VRYLSSAAIFSQARARLFEKEDDAPLGLAGVQSRRAFVDLGPLAMGADQFKLRLDLDAGLYIACVLRMRGFRHQSRHRA